MFFCRLQGTESVKEFLVAKLKETEAALKRSLDEKGLTLRQSASDQEVISFLDSRTQVRFTIRRPPPKQHLCGLYPLPILKCARSSAFESVC